MTTQPAPDNSPFNRIPTRGDLIMIHCTPTTLPVPTFDAAGQTVETLTYHAELDKPWIGISRGRLGNTRNRGFETTLDIADEGHRATAEQWIEDDPATRRQYSTAPRVCIVWHSTARD